MFVCYYIVFNVFACSSFCGYLLCVIECMCMLNICGIVVSCLCCVEHLYHVCLSSGECVFVWWIVCLLNMFSLYLLKAELSMWLNICSICSAMFVCYYIVLNTFACCSI